MMLYVLVFLVGILIGMWVKGLQQPVEIIAPLPEVAPVELPAVAQAAPPSPPEQPRATPRMVFDPASRKVRRQL